MGLIPYEEMYRLQQLRHAEVVSGSTDETLFLLEHPPVVTFGKNRGISHLLSDESTLDAAGIALHPTDRGGDITYHGPGQLVVYPILALSKEDGEQDIKRYVSALEEVMIRTLADFFITAKRIAGLRGIWIDNGTDKPAKIGAIGVRLRQWTTLHGFAINVHPNMQHFKHIIPCGLADKEVTSMAHQLAHQDQEAKPTAAKPGAFRAEALGAEALGAEALTVTAVAKRVTVHMSMMFDRDIAHYTASSVPSDAQIIPAKININAAEVSA